MKPIIDDKDIIGKKFQSNSCNDFTVIRRTNNKTKGNHGNILYEIEFDEINGVKFKKEVTKHDILHGNIRNPYYPSVYSIGYIGDIYTKDKQYIYNKWRKMISRCYNEKDGKFKNYGANNVTVCDRWHCFKNFYDDFSKIDGYDPDINQSLDKDIKSKRDKKIYSLETCTLLSASKNSKEMKNRTSPYFIAIDPNGYKYISNCQRDFVRDYGLNRSCINDVLKGKQKHHRGWSFKYLDKDGELI